MVSDLLQKQIDEFKKEIRSESYPMSIGEMMNLYEKGEVDLHPEFQRFFRWTSLQRTRLIESILLGIPLPAIFLVQRDDGVLDVIDGLQRLSTIFQFAGLLKDEAGEFQPELILQGTKYLPSLENVRWEAEEVDTPQLSTSQRLVFKRGKLNLIILERLSDPDAKYELFQRLNTGGSELSDQEVRNCMLLMVDRSFYIWLAEMAKYPTFTSTISLSERKEQERYELELIVRFIVMQKIGDAEKGLSGLKDLGDYLTEQVVELAKDVAYPRQSISQRFKDTMDLIAESLGEDAFLPYRPDRDRFSGPFSVAAFEALTYGLSRNLESWQRLPAPDRNEKLRGLVIDMWQDDDQWRTQTGTGIRAESRLPFVIGYAPVHFGVS